VNVLSGQDKTQVKKGGKEERRKGQEKRRMSVLKGEDKRRVSVLKGEKQSTKMC
jgi:hypothetical protein